jgi:hypothetical protein
MELHSSSASVGLGQVSAAILRSERPVLHSYQTLSQIHIVGVSLEMNTDKQADIQAVTVTTARLHEKLNMYTNVCNISKYQIWLKSVADFVHTDRDLFIANAMYGSDKMMRS